MAANSIPEDDKKRKQREYMRKYAAKWRAANLEKHREYNRKWSRANPDKTRRARRRCIARKKAAGLCVWCRSPELKSKTLCADCLQKNKDSTAKWRAANLEKQRRKNRIAARKRRAAHPRKLRKYRKEHYRANRDRLLAQRRAKEGSISREEYLRLVQKQTRSEVVAKLAELRAKVDEHSTKKKRSRSADGTEKNRRYIETRKLVDQAVPRFQDILSMRTKSIAELRRFGCSDNEIEALRMPGSRTPRVAARYFVSFETGKPFDTVAQYDKRGLKLETRPS